MVGLASDPFTCVWNDAAATIIPATIIRERDGEHLLGTRVALGTALGAFRHCFIKSALLSNPGGWRVIDLFSKEETKVLGRLNKTPNAQS